MSDVITRTEAAIVGPALGTATVTWVESPRAGFVERRRPGRIENASPELIALMRKPTPEAIEQIALYDAPNFVLPDPTRDGTQISLRKLAHFGVAFGVCAIGWTAAFKLMMLNWG